MNGKQLQAAIFSRYGLQPSKASLKNTINRAIRTLPGGAETLDAIESENAARNHADRHRAIDRVIAIDNAIDALEKIREAMSTHVIKSVGGSA